MHRPRVPQRRAGSWATTLVLAVALVACMSIPGAAPIAFEHGADSLAGSLVLPDGGAPPRAILVFVHGDGPQDRTGHDYYRPIFERLRRARYASLSWDKPGTGDSTGDWLAHSMPDRQAETLAAIAWLRARFGACLPPIGLFGFSQAGWVVPAVAADSGDVDFAIGVGFAIDWVEQGRFHARVRLRRDGRSAGELEAVLAAQARETALYRAGVTRERFVAERGSADGVPEPARFGFVARNVGADALDDHRRLRKPLLVTLGDHDLNVDVRDTARWLATPAIRRTNLRTVLVPGATHSMLRVADFDVQSPGVGTWLKLVWQGESALAPEFMNTVEAWLERTVTASMRPSPSDCAASRSE